jgi:uncharacterized membrane protein
VSGDHGDAPIGPLPARVNRLLLLAIAPLVLATLVGLVVLWPGDPPARPSNLGAPAALETATVGTVTEGPCGGGGQGGRGTCQTATLRLTSGPDEGTSTVLEVSVGPGNPSLERGDRIVVGRVPDPAQGNVYYFSDYQRRAPLVVLALLFAGVVVAIGRLRGLTALLGLVVTFAVLVKFILPAVLEGESPVLVAIVGSAAAMLVVLYLSHGVNAQTTTAVLGTLVSLLVIGLLAALFVDVARIVSLASEDATFLQISASQVNLRGVLLGGIIIGSLGVLNDVTVTQASAVWTLRAANPAWGPRRLYKAAMRIGRDHIASVVDTLVLAYAGASLPLLLLFTLANRPVGDVLTGALMAEEIVRALVGSIGLVLSVPLTSALAALVAAQAGQPRGEGREGPEGGGAGRRAIVKGPKSRPRPGTRPSRPRRRGGRGPSHS